MYAELRGGAFTRGGTFDISYSLADSNAISFRGRLAAWSDYVQGNPGQAVDHTMIDVQAHRLTDCGSSSRGISDSRDCTEHQGADVEGNFDAPILWVIKATERRSDRHRFTGVA